MVFVIRSLILFSAWTILGISSTVRADGVSEIEIPVTEQRQGDTDDSKSAASFDKRLPPVVPGESHPDGRQEMNIWSTSGPVPVSKAPEPFKKYDARELVTGGVSVIVDEREKTPLQHGHVKNSDSVGLNHSE